ncbi:LysR family transcriptional regulator ArgP [Marinobacter sp. CHS3-4]|uniref:LysR family transcriptional regulator ArgP n=1 Tax=Marinobacter sp. CHS3-4 TaxID=3045174 RepID=UPI0024B54674|nr:LysR family transcriptional regulator ArgP [Marinobacter sp. CHS3-4]MDI9246024.1 LysR family transcriptional regulator ArgP [Marinobacter sp. CHS3-4]
MIDYKLIQALAAVVENGGFERAGDALGLTQSAVSQRIKSLEVRLGLPVMTRHPELRPTPAGQKLLNHFQQVQLLERDLTRNIPSLAEETTRLRIAINADSVSTWWATAVAEFFREEGVLMDLVIEDQDVGLRRMREGDVAACLCSSPQPVAGARAVPLGSITYRALATEQYIQHYFADGISTEALAVAPAIVYGPNDQLQHRFLQSFGYHGSFRFHLCPSSEGFVRFATAGIGYGMIPEIQARHWLKNNLLVDLAPEHALNVPLYWHFWRHSGDLLQTLTRLLERKTEEIQQWTI